MRTNLVTTAALSLAFAGSATARAQDTNAPVVVNPPAPVVVVQPPSPEPAPVIVAPTPAPVVSHDPITVATASDYHPHAGLIFGGLAIFGAAYAASAITGAVISDTCNSGDSSTFGCTTQRWPLYVPVAGPFIEMGYVNGSNNNTARVLLAIDGGVQIGGLAMAITGAALSAVPTHRHTYTQKEHKLNFAPYGSATGSGLAAFGRF